MIILTIGLTILFNSYIIPTELILRILHGIKTDIGGILSWIRKEPKRDILLKTIKIMETKVAVEGKPLSQEDFKKIEEVQQQIDGIDTNQEEKDTFQNTGCCFEGFCRHKCLFINCIVLLTFSLVILTLIAMVLSAILLGVYGNIQKDICSPIQRLNIMRKLANGDNASIIPEEKRLQIVSQNSTHVLIVMPCSSSVMDESGNTFSIKDPYNLNCNESQNFSYIEQIRIWIG
jgi:hypothetical protein